MPKSTSVTLDEHLVGFIDRQIAEGRYGSASEVVRAALEFLEEHEQLEALRGALIEGEQSDPRRLSMSRPSSKPGDPPIGRCPTSSRRGRRPISARSGTIRAAGGVAPGRAISAPDPGCARAALA